MSEAEFPEIPGYTVLSCLGKGGMATIYLAEQHSFERKVALKVMALNLLSDPSFGDRFLREARIVAQLTHRHFVPVYEVGHHGDFHFMSMEYLPGGDLKDLLEKGLPLASGLRIIEEVADALTYAASKNCIHRDIKPANILFREDGSAVVCDFGIARYESSATQMTMVGTVIGTPRYMSPEQIQALPLDGRSDLYSLGVILFELLTGHVPYESDSAITSGILHVTEPIPQLPDNLAAFQPLIDKALAKLPDDRFQTGHEMIRAIQLLEETESELIDGSSVTVVISKDEIQSGLQRRGAHSQTNRSFHSQGASQVPLRSKISPQYGGRATSAKGVDAAGQANRSRGWIIALSLAAAIGTGSLAWWYIKSGSVSSEGSEQQTPSPIFDNKVQELNRLAIDSLKAGRLYAPPDDNAQHYLTSALVLSPGDQKATTNIVRLFTIYLERAEDGLSKGDLKEADNMLNQASQISFYIDDKSMLEQQASLREQLARTKQQSLIEVERKSEISRLLDDAAEKVKSGNLTTPTGNSAYSIYQQVLALDPSNVDAVAGIENIAGGLLDQAREHVDLGELGRARAYISAAIQIFPRHPQVTVVRELLEAEEAKQRQEITLAQKQKTSAFEQEQRKLEEQRQKSIDEMRALLAGAAEDLDARRLESAREKFSMTLSIDPANVDALNGLEDVATQYINIAREALAASRLDEAEQSLKKASELSPTNSQYREVQTALIDAQDKLRRQAAEQRVRSERIDTLLKGSMLAMEAGNLYLPKYNNALENLQSALKIDPNNQQALALEERLSTEIYKAGSTLIDEGRFEEAQLAVDALVKNRAAVAQVKNLQGALVGKQKELAQALAGQRAREATEKTRLAKLEADRQKKEKAEKFAREQARPAKVPADIPAVSSQPSDRLAAEKSKKMAAEQARLTRRAIAQRDFGAAQQYIDRISDIEPGYAELAALSEELAYSRRSQEQAMELLAAADLLTATPYKKPGFLGNNDEARKTLRTAYSKIDSARGVDPQNPALEHSQQILIDKYSAIIEAHLADSDLDEAREFLEDLTATGISSPAVDSLKQKFSLREEDSGESKKGVAVGVF